jgi:uncharacterized lipoprotein YajG
MKLKFVLALAGSVALAGCTKQQATNVVNAVFTVEQAACMAANAGVIGDSNAVQEFEQLCQLSASEEASIVSFINNMQTQHPDKVAALRAAKK